MPHPGRNTDRWRERARRFAEGEGEGAGSDGTGAEWPRFRLSTWATLWIPVIVSFLVQVPASVLMVRGRGPLSTFDEDPERLAILLGLTLIGPAALIFARRFPGPVVAVVSAATVACLLITRVNAPPYVALAFAIVGAVVRGARMWAWVSLAVGWAVAILAGAVLGLPWEPAAVVAVTLGLLLLLGVGEAVRIRRQRFDELRRRAADRRLTAVQAERVRIARELHDVLAHSLSQINVQAGVGLHLIDSQPEKAASALADIKEASKRALDEVRSVLGVLRDGQDASADPSAQEAPLVPEPDLSRLASLVASVSSQGIAVTLDNGIADAPKPAQLALYRIVQESLTNVVRHAHATRADVVLTESADAYTVEVTDDGTGAPDAGAAPAVRHEGRGLLGMRERAALLGGTLDAARRPGGGFRVAAVIPKTRTGASNDAPDPTDGGRA